MCVAIPAKQLDPAHAMTDIGLLHDIGFFKFGMKAGPTATGRELAALAEQRNATAYAMILSIVPMLIEFSTERRLGTGFSCHPVLLGCQFGFPFFIRLVYSAHFMNPLVAFNHDARHFTQFRLASSC